VNDLRLRRVKRVLRLGFSSAWGPSAALGAVLLTGNPVQAEYTVAAKARTEGAVAFRGHGSTGVPLMVRVFNYTMLSVPAIEGTIATTTRLLETADLKVHWVRCTSGKASPRQCFGPSPAGSLDLRLLPPPRDVDSHASSRRMGLGLAAVDEQGFGFIANVYVPEKSRFAGITLMPSESLAGLVAAHELAHLLLGNADHTESGLMQAEWSVWELTPGRESSWRFSPLEAVRLRQAARRLVSRELSSSLR